MDSANLLALHEKIKKLKFDDLMLIYMNLDMQGTFAEKPDLKKIFKTYIVRALLEEGIR